MARPAVFVRADAGARIGWGHLVRCGALARELERRGARVSWWLRDSDAAALGSLLARWEVRVLSRDIGGGDLPPEFRAGDWIVVDRYGWGLREQRALKRAGARLLWLDDGGRGRFEADLVLNQNLGAASRGCRGAKVLAGPRYALLRPEFRRPPRRRTFPSGARRILVTLGGSDPLGLAPRVCRSLEGFEVTCVAGPSAAERAFPAGVRLVRGASAGEMRALMVSCDLAVATSSSVCWELARLGVPMAVISAAPNQEPVRRALREAGAALDLGRGGRIGRGALAALAADADARRRLSGRAARIVDGRGAERVARAMGIGT